MNYGFTADEAIDRMTMLGDISQGSADKMLRIAAAYGQMSSAGKVQLEDIRQMIDAGFNPLQEISETTGESMDSLYERISDGALAVDEITASMQRSTSEGGKYFQSMAKQSQTVAGQFSTLKDNFQQMTGEVFSGLSKSVGSKLLPLAIGWVDTLSTAFAQNGVIGISTALGSILSQAVTMASQQAPQLISLAVTIIQSLIMGLNSNAPQLVQGGVAIITALATGIMQLLPSLGTLGLTIIQELYNVIVSQGPGLLQAGYDLLYNVVNGFVSAIPTALPQILSFIQSIGDYLAAAAPTLIQKGFELLSMLVDGIISAIPILVQQVPQIITTFANIINDNFPTILAKGAELIVQFVKGILSSIPVIISSIPQIVEAIVSVIEAFNWLSLGSKIITLFKNGITSMVGAVKSAGKSVYNAVHDAIVNLPSTLANLGKSAMYSLSSTISGLVGYVKTAALRIASSIESAINTIPGKMLSIGRNIVQGLWNGISDMTGWILSKIRGFGSSVLNGIKDFFGIHSPSIVMREEVGQWLAKGIGVGFEKYNPMAQIQKTLDVGVRGLQQSLFAGSGNTTNQTNNFYGIRTPDQVARDLRMQQFYGLAGARA